MSSAPPAVSPWLVPEDPELMGSRRLSPPSIRSCQTISENFLHLHVVDREEEIQQVFSSTRLDQTAVCKPGALLPWLQHPACVCWTVVRSWSVLDGTLIVCFRGYPGGDFGFRCLLGTCLLTGSAGGTDGWIDGCTDRWMDAWMDTDAEAGHVHVLCCSEGP